MKILFCIAGVCSYGIIESDIQKKDHLIIEARRAFSIEINQASKIQSPRGGPVGFMISMYKNVTMHCNFISDMAEDSPFYKGISEVIKREAIHEN